MSYRPVRPDGLDLHTGRSMRSPSLSSDIPSISGRSTAPTPPPVNPQPAYVTSSEASKLISSEIGESVLVSQAALALLNAFIDQTLFTLLSAAHSTSLNRLQAAVPIVLKPRLGQAALQAADEELREYLDDIDEDGSRGEGDTSNSSVDFDIELAWKLARLRCMVYTRLGDLEEEDEEDYIEQEQLHEHVGGFSHASSRSITLKPASAIFLTAVLEFIGEQALFYAAQHAQRRLHHRRSLEQSPMTDPSSNVQEIHLEEVDMFQVGRESPLSRLWRSWRRNLRSPRETFSRPMSPEFFPPANEVSTLESRKNSIGIPIGTINEERSQNPSLEAVLESSLPSQIPLPMSDNDVNEIEVPGVAREIKDDENAQSEVPMPERSQRRPSSMTAFPTDIPTATTSADNVPLHQERISQRPQAHHSRSSSLPPPAQTPFVASDESQRNHNITATVVENNEAKETDSQTDVQEDYKFANQNAHDVDQTSPTEDEHIRLGNVAAAVSAVAGALGIGAAAASQNSGEAKALSPTQEHEVNPARTVAEEFLGPSSGVLPPSDAVTAASITSAGDFENIHLPEEQSRAEKELIPVAHAEESDPEDLALSSTDEEPNEVEKSKANEVHELSDNNPSAMNQRSFYHEVDEKEEEAPSEYVSSNTKTSPDPNEPPKVYQPGKPTDASNFGERNVSQDRRDIHATMAEPMTTANKRVQDPAVPEAPSVYQAVTAPVVARAGIGHNETQNIQPPASTTNERERSLAAPTARPSTGVPAPVPGEVASVERTRTSHSSATSKSSGYSNHSKSSSSSSKLLGFTRDPQGRPQQLYVSNNLVSNNVNGTRAGGSGSGSSAKEPSLATSTSQLIGKRLNPKLRTGSDEEWRANSPIDAYDETRKRNLEILINSDETLHYTLTPVSARAENFPVPPTQLTQSPDYADPLPKTSRSFVPTAITGLRSNPPQPTLTSSTMTQKVASSSQNAAPALSASPKGKNFLGAPRDARVEQSTLRDLADYARSTGPEHATQLPKVLSSRLPNLDTKKASSGAVTNTPPQNLPVVSGPMGSSSSMPNRNPSNQSQARSKFQPRDAAPSKHAESGDLIDFIRQGPPRAPGDHRIDRNVAPFRRTMDSDDLNGLAPPRDGDQNGASSVASTQNSSVAAKSIQSSMNSRTGLLDSSKKANTKPFNGYTTSPIRNLRQSALAEDAGPKRKQRRIPDPYSIDYSDEESDEKLATPKPKTQEESLIDFLRNTAPPPGMAPQPIMASTSSGASASTARKEPTNPGLKDRLLRTASMTGLSRKASLPDAKTAQVADEPPSYYRGAKAPRPESPHLSQAGSKLDSYRPTNPTHAAHVERNRRKSRDAADARNPRATGNTADLADYLKNSGPPAAPRGQADLVKEDAGILKFFSRKGSFRR